MSRQLSWWQRREQNQQPEAPRIEGRWRMPAGIAGCGNGPVIGLSKFFLLFHLLFLIQILLAQVKLETGVKR
jgi:hypothetical protein